MGSRRLERLLRFAGFASFFLAVFVSGIAFSEEQSRLDGAPDEEISKWPCTSSTVLKSPSARPKQTADNSLVE